MHGFKCSLSDRYVIHIEVYVNVFEMWAIHVSCLQISKRDGQPELSQDFSINLFE